MGAEGRAVAACLGVVAASAGCRSAGVEGTKVEAKVEARMGANGAVARSEA